MKFTPTTLSGIFQLQPGLKADERGHFAKTMQKSLLGRHGLETTYQEIYHSVSKTNILRGMHFQVPPADGAKIVCCLGGMVQDALLDLRVGSSTYGHNIMVPLRGEQTNMLYIPAGIAHGFWVGQGPATLLYYQHAEYAPEQDKGIAWNKAGINWPCKTPIMSARDAEFPGLAEFQSPFIFDALGSPLCV
jgi:dTDP-4-dehydrorhamnose 3,5-epimerase